jgi:hypothetical protein
MGYGARASKGIRAAVVCGIALVALAVLGAGRNSSLLPRVMAAGSPNGAVDQACDRACLDGFVDQYLAALATHDPSKLPLAKDVKSAETGQAVALGKGMWISADQIGIYRLRFDDPATGEAGIFALTDEHGLPGMLALRLKIRGRKIAEVESIIVRQDIPGQGGVLATTTMFAPVLVTPLDRKWFLLPDPLLEKAVEPAQRTSREKMLAAANAYFDGIEKSSSDGVPLDDGCVRRDNGVHTTLNPGASPIDPAFPSFRVFGLTCAAQLDSHYYSVIETIRGRRFPIVDEEHGLVFAVVMFDHPGVATSVDVPGVGKVAVPATYRVPSSFIVPILFKIQDGKIVRIEALERVVPYGMSPGWGNAN